MGVRFLSLERKVGGSYLVVLSIRVVFEVIVDRDDLGIVFGIRKSIKVVWGNNDFYSWGEIRVWKEVREVGGV